MKREFYGYEIAGIKLHAAIDVVIRHNRIHGCSLGTWLDWQAQGTRLSRNPPSDQQKYVDVKQPVYARANAYTAGARPFEGEREPWVLGAATATVVDEDDAVWLVTDLPEAFDEVRVGVITGRDLDRVRCADAEFEEVDGSPAVMDIDLSGACRQPGRDGAVGPLAHLWSGPCRTRVF
ncbi:hypothetical protein AB0H28_23200 [Micromonospora sp. NPDC050980]|uniref:hypothetical protein n=1 Tax=Micromonospora sp. NPDC050980 TaxID=3155161 RepID=UPI0033D7B369